MSQNVLISHFVSACVFLQRFNSKRREFFYHFLLVCSMGSDQFQFFRMFSVLLSFIETPGIFRGLRLVWLKVARLLQISATFVSLNRANYFLRGLKKANRLNRRNSEDWETPGRNSFPRNTDEECAHDRNYIHPSKTRSLHR